MKRTHQKIVSALLAIVLLFTLTACGSEGTAAPGTIKITDSTEDLFVGDEIHLTATTEPGTEAVAWSSLDTAIATIDGNGVVTALSSGEVAIRASFESKPEVYDEISLRVGQHVSSIEVASKTLVLLLGSAKADSPVEVTILPEDALIQEITLHSTDENVVSVNSDGTLHAVSTGKAEVEVTSADPICEESALISVTVQQGVESIALSEESVELYQDDQPLQLLATVLPEDAADPSVEWSSSDENIALVSEDGAVKAVNAGDAEITCRALDGSDVEQSTTVHVVVGTSKVTLEENSASLLLGGDPALAGIQLAVNVEPEDTSFPAVVWTSSDESVATVDENGLVTGLSEGEAVITAATSDPRNQEKVTASATVKVGNAVQEISFSNENLRIAKGKDKRLKPVFTPEEVLISKVEWSSDNKDVATVDKNGTVHGVSEGTATITCAATDGTGVSSSVKVEIYQPVTSISLKKTNSDHKATSRLFVDGDIIITANVSPSNATDKTLIWSVSDSSKASISEHGSYAVVTGKKKGTVKVTAKAADGSGVSKATGITIEPKVPITLEGISRSGDVVGLKVRNRCSNTTIHNFDFDITLYTITGDKMMTSGSYSLGSNETIKSGKTVTIRRRFSNFSKAYAVDITITGVKLSDGTYYAIPYSAQQDLSFTF